MPKATLTSRAVKNKDTGIEISIPTFRQTKELFGHVSIYQVVLVSNLACFKSPSHKESDVVQFSVEKKMNEFEELRNRILKEYPCTVLPPINKKTVLLMNDTVLKERKNSLDNLMKAIASAPKIAYCIPVLEFLGVDSLRAKKFNRGEPLLDQKQEEDSATITSSNSEEQNDNPLQDQQENFEAFEKEEINETNDDLFANDTRTTTDDLFGEEQEAGTSRVGGNVKVFDGQDLKRELTEDDEKDFTFVQDGILSRTKKVAVGVDQHGEIITEDNSDLLTIEDDLDKLMTLNTESKQVKNQISSREGNSKNDNNAVDRPSLPSKPTLPSKPPKPSLAAKPGMKPQPSTTKPSVPQKPKSNPTTSESIDDLGQDDIMKYLQDNVDSNTEELDLFS